MFCVLWREKEPGVCWRRRDKNNFSRFLPYAVCYLLEICVCVARIKLHPASLLFVWREGNKSCTDCSLVLFCYYYKCSSLHRNSKAVENKTKLFFPFPPCFHQQPAECLSQLASQPSSPSLQIQVVDVPFSNLVSYGENKIV